MIGALLVGVSSLVASVPASAALDLLKTPAKVSALAARSTMLAVASAGQRLVAVGERGLIIYSDDRGASWQQASVPVSVTLTTVTFATPEQGWAGGHDGVILHTTDAGKSWSKQFDGNDANQLVIADLQGQIEGQQAALEQAKPADKEAAQMRLDALQFALEDVQAGAEFGPSRPILGLYFQDASNGLAVGSFGQIFHTTDGGKSWQSWGGRINNPDGFHYNSIARLADGSLMIAGEAGKLRRSRDDGQTWDTLETGYTGHLYGALALPGTRVLLAFGFGGNVLRSEDDGQSWNALPRQINKALVGGAVLSDNRVLLLGSNRVLLLSQDQGRTFAPVAGEPGRPVSALLPLNPQGSELAMAGAGGVAVRPLDSSSR